VDDVVDLIALEAEHFGEAPSDFVEQDHRAKGGGTVEPLLAASREDDGIEVVVAELAGGVAQLRVETEVCTVAVPLPDGSAVRDDGPPAATPCATHVIMRETGTRTLTS